MNSGSIGTLRLLALAMLTAAVVACTGGDAGTSHFQPPADQPGTAAEAIAVSQQAGTGLSPSSLDVALRQPLATGNPATTASGSSAAGKPA